MEIARQRLHHSQGTLDLEVTANSGGLSAEDSAGAPVGARVAGSASRLLWQTLEAAYARLGFDAVGDEAFRALALARVVEPTSKG